MEKGSAGSHVIEEEACKTYLCLFNTHICIASHLNKSDSGQGTTIK